MAADDILVRERGAEIVASLDLFFELRVVLAREVAVEDLEEDGDGVFVVLLGVPYRRAAAAVVRAEVPVEVDVLADHLEVGVGVVDVVVGGGNGEEEGVEGGAEDEVGEEDSDVVSEFVREETDYGRSYEDAEGEDGVHEGDVDVADANVLHVDGEVRGDGEHGAVEEEQRQLQRKQVHVRRKHLRHLLHGTPPSFERHFEMDLFF